jgi:hypothetical protein
MAGFKGTDTCDDTLDAWLGSTTLGPATVYIALFTAAPTAGGGGTEVTGGSYARVAVTNNATNFPAASGASKSNGTLIDFGTATADWAPSGTPVVGAAAVVTASGALGTDDIIYYGPLSTPRIILNGDPVSVPIGGAVFTEV